MTLTSLSFSRGLFHMQWMWRSKFESRRHPLPHKDQWALDGAFKATLLPHWPPRAPHCRELIAATAPGNLPQKLTQGPHCAQDGKSERRLQNIGYRVDRPMDNPVLEETKYLQKKCMIAWCWYPGFRFTRLKERYSSNVGRSAELQIH